MSTNSATSSNSATTGKEDCQCINATSILTSLTNRYCTLSTENSINTKYGVRLVWDGSCVPFHYGSSHCYQHDLLSDDQQCNMKRLIRQQEQQQNENDGNSIFNLNITGAIPSTSNSNSNKILPAYCFRPWCYVNPKTCSKNSYERIYKSSYFYGDETITGIGGEEVDLFYSYSTCNSSADDWFDIEADIVGSDKLFGGVDLEAAIPTYMMPMLYKRDNNGDIFQELGDEYYDNTIPFEGVYIHFVKEIMAISNGDIRSMNFTHRSKVSGVVHPTSSFTAAVQDIEDGLVDMAVGPFWVTAQRLQMASYSLPFIYDKTYLVIPKPAVSSTLADEAQKVLAPFSLGLWGLLLAVIAMTALLSVWFVDEAKLRYKPIGKQNKRSGMQQIPSRSKRSKGTKRRQIALFGRLALDQCLQKGLFFCSAGVEQEERSSLPTKLLLFGFGFFILIAVSAYVANLAAFLTMSAATDYVKTIDEAVAAAYRICAHPALRTELQTAYPDAIFYFHEGDGEFPGVMKDYTEGKCKVLAIGYEDTSMDQGFLESMCQHGLVFTDSVLAEIPMAFPMRQSMTNGFNYWMVVGKRLGVNLQASKVEFPVQIGCDVHLSEEVEGDEMGEITVKNMFLPITFFLAFAIVAVLLQIRHTQNMKKGRQSLVGGRSSFDLMAGLKKSMANKKYDEENDFDDLEEEKIDNNSALPQQSMGDQPSEDSFGENKKPTVSFGNVKFEDYDGFAEAENMDMSLNSFSSR